MRVERDYTGFATWEVGQCFRAHLDGRSLDEVARSIPMDHRDLRRVVEKAPYPFIGTNTVDLIFLALGLSLGDLTNAGELTPIPNKAKADPYRMAEDEFFCREYDATEEEIETRAQELVQLRATVLATPQSV